MITRVMVKSCTGQVRQRENAVALSRASTCRIVLSVSEQDGERYL